MALESTATNKTIREIIKDIREGTLKPDPSFQRRLVWTNKHKIELIKTVLMGFPFPEIFLALGSLKTSSGEGTMLVVDGQQRVTTLFQYFMASPDLKLGRSVPAYNELSNKAQKAFLSYKVVVRDLGGAPRDVIREAFERMNSTRYALNAMELDNARYEGRFIEFGRELADDGFFSRNHIFKPADIRRMRDVRFCLRLVATLMSTYFQDNKELRNFFIRYAEHFPQKNEIDGQIKRVTEFIEGCEFPEDCRIWRQADCFTALVELHRILIKKKIRLPKGSVRAELLDFYERVSAPPRQSESKSITEYRLASLQGVNHRSNQIKRASAFRSVLKPWLPRDRNSAVATQNRRQIPKHGN